MAFTNYFWIIQTCNRDKMRVEEIPWQRVDELEVPYFFSATENRNPRQKWNGADAEVHNKVLNAENRLNPTPRAYIILQKTTWTLTRIDRHRPLGRIVEAKTRIEG